MVNTVLQEFEIVDAENMRGWVRKHRTGYEFISVVPIKFSLNDDGQWVAVTYLVLYRHYE